MNDAMRKANNIIDFQKGLLQWMEASAGIYGFEDGLSAQDKLGILSTSIVDVCMKNDMSAEDEFLNMARSARRMEEFSNGLQELINMFKQLKGACKNEEDTDTI